MVSPAHGHAVGGRIGDGGGVVDVLPGHGLAGDQRAAPAEAGRQRDLGVALGQQRVADQVVERAGEGAAAVEQPLGAGEFGAQHGLVGGADALDQRGHGGIGGDGIGQHRDQPVGHVAHAPAVHLHVEARQELAVRARGDQQRVADPHRLGQRIVGVAGEDDVDALDAGGELGVDVEAVVRQQHHHLRALRARLGHRSAQAALADAERPVGHHPARVGDGRIGEGLTDHGDGDAAALEQARGVEHGLGEVGIAHVAGEERHAGGAGTIHAAEQLGDAAGAQRELPMAGGRLHAQRLAARRPCRRPWWRAP